MRIKKYINIFLFYVCPFFRKEMIIFSFEKKKIKYSIKYVVKILNKVNIPYRIYKFPTENMVILQLYSTERGITKVLKQYFSNKYKNFGKDKKKWIKL